MAFPLGKARNSRDSFPPTFTFYNIKKGVMRSLNHLPCSLLEFYKGAASECVAQGVVLYKAPNAPWLLLFASSCEGKGNNECKSHAPMGHRSEDEVEFRMQRCHAGQRSAAAAPSCLRQDGELLPATGMGKTFTTTRSSLNQAGSGW